ncbi:hypothetical protein Mal64_02520 [Pseudobythopirellula maris]|uniref:Uncharacterized protein n=1 Tax=Pseudobythopirellula maris TaxID=2527991 RepID=A0A5C5ZRF0_9BACT|nr:hypothetical protein [Pseudobythopirellula maris]TWT89870.1 hypothetical protein Mal64_02520 [Pseudobythopirellula maris]
MSEPYSTFDTFTVEGYAPPEAAGAPLPPTLLKLPWVEVESHTSEANATKSDATSTRVDANSQPRPSSHFALANDPSTQATPDQSAADRAVAVKEIAPEAVAATDEAVRIDIGHAASATVGDRVRLHEGESPVAIELSGPWSERVGTTARWAVLLGLLSAAGVSIALLAGAASGVEADAPGPEIDSVMGDFDATPWGSDPAGWGGGELLANDGLSPIDSDAASLRSGARPGYVPPAYESPQEGVARRQTQSPTGLSASGPVGLAAARDAAPRAVLGERLTPLEPHRVVASDRVAMLPAEQAARPSTATQHAEQSNDAQGYPKTPHRATRWSPSSH